MFLMGENLSHKITTPWKNFTPNINWRANILNKSKSKRPNFTFFWTVEFQMFCTIMY